MTSCMARCWSSALAASRRQAMGHHGAVVLLEAAHPVEALQEGDGCAHHVLVQPEHDACTVASLAPLGSLKHPAACAASFPAPALKAIWLALSMCRFCAFSFIPLLGLLAASSSLDCSCQVARATGRVWPFCCSSELGGVPEPSRGWAACCISSYAAGCQAGPVALSQRSQELSSRWRLLNDQSQVLSVPHTLRRRYSPPACMFPSSVCNRSTRSTGHKI